jgi:hypothetical protein
MGASFDGQERPTRDGQPDDQMLVHIVAADTETRKGIVSQLDSPGGEREPP